MDRLSLCKLDIRNDFHDCLFSDGSIDNGAGVSVFEKYDVGTINEALSDGSAFSDLPREQLDVYVITMQNNAKTIATENGISVPTITAPPEVSSVMADAIPSVGNATVTHTQDEVTQTHPSANYVPRAKQPKHGVQTFEEYYSEIDAMSNRDRVKDAQKRIVRPENDEFGKNENRVKRYNHRDKKNAQRADFTPEITRPKAKNRVKQFDAPSRH